MGLITFIVRRKKRVLFILVGVLYLGIAYQLITLERKDKNVDSQSFFPMKLDIVDQYDWLDTGTLSYEDIKEPGPLQGPDINPQNGDDDQTSNIMDYRRKRFENYTRNEGNRTGLGEQGKAVPLLPSEVALGQSQMEDYGFHLLISDKIPLDRSLPDVRADQCKSVVYPKDLPTLSVIIIFCNEAFSTLMRTVHGVINRTPPEYLHEVILVDDTSDHEDLKQHLDEYVAETWPDGIIKIIRLSERSGLIRTRIAGAKQATGDVIAVFDAHIEVTKGWAEPILLAIKENRKTLVAPSLDYVDLKNFKYIRGGDFANVKFRWDMGYQWIGLPPWEIQSATVPIPSQVLVGCAFAMDREMFFYMGSFDPGLEVWGGENMEIGIRVSMCGGRVVNLPCSHVAHLFRNRKPWTVSSMSMYKKNFRRVAEVWMDDYKKYFYEMIPEAKDLDFGNITDRLALKKELGCHDFGWFVKNTNKFVYDQNVTAWGRLKSMKENAYWCLDMLGWEAAGVRLGLYGCGGSRNAQTFSLTPDGVFRAEYHCAEYIEKAPEKDVKLEMCKGSKQQNWIYDVGSKEFRQTATGLCLDWKDVTGIASKKYVTLRACNGGISQQWEWEHFTPPMPHMSGGLARSRH